MVSRSIEDITNYGANSRDIRGFNPETNTFILNTTDQHGSDGQLVSAHNALVWGLVEPVPVNQPQHGRKRKRSA